MHIVENTNILEYKNLNDTLIKQNDIFKIIIKVTLKNILYQYIKLVCISMIMWKTDMNLSMFIKQF